MSYRSLRKGPASALRARIRARVESLETRALLSAGDLDGTWGSGGLVQTNFNTNGVDRSDLAFAVAVQEDGKIVTAGNSSDGDSQQFALTRHNRDGSLDAAGFSGGQVLTSFGAGLTSYAHGVAIDSQDRIVVVGRTGVPEVGADVLSVARYFPNGQLDTNFGNGGTALFEQFSVFDASVVIDDSDRILIGFSAGAVTGGDQGNITDLAVVRLTASGALDTNLFGSGGVTYADVGPVDISGGIAIDGNGQIVQAGTATASIDDFFANANGNLVAVRYNASGSRDTSYGALLTAAYQSDFPLYRVKSIMVDADDSLIVAGVENVAIPGDFPRGELTLARITADGSSATRAVPGLRNDSLNWSMAVQVDGKIVVAGDNYLTPSGQDPLVEQYVIARFTPGFSLDTEFGGGDGVYVSPTNRTFATGVVSDFDGQILVAGVTVGAGGSDFLLARHEIALTPGGVVATANAGAGIPAGGTEYVVQEGSNITLTGTGSLVINGSGGDVTFVQNQRRIETPTGGGGTDGDFELVWDLDGDGEFDDHTGANPVLTGVDDGEQTVTLGVVATSNPSVILATSAATVRVTNIAPVGTINAPAPTQLLREDEPITITANVVDAPADTHTFTWTITGPLTNQTVTTSVRSVTFTPPDNGAYTINLKVKDDDGGEHPNVAPLTINVENKAPTAQINGGNITVAEGTSVGFTSTSGDVQADTLSFQWIVKRNGAAYASGTSENFGFVPDDDGLYQVNLTVSDEDGGVTQATAVFVEATNVTPIPDVTGDTLGVRGQQRTLALAAIDPSAADTAAGFTFTVDWGDGSAVETYQPGITAANHAYAENGVYTVAVTAMDQDDAVSEPLNFTMLTQSAALENGILNVSGGTGHDKIRVFRTASGDVSVGISDVGGGALEFVQTYTDPVTRVVIHAQAGDDKLDASAMNIPVEMYGGPGNDKLVGGSAADILVGGGGDDFLIGNAGRDLLIGGRDADRLLGESDEDILVGGYTAHDGDLLALRQISDEWRSSRSYLERVSNIRGPVTTGVNGSAFLRADATTWDDAAVDLLSGDADRDWFFFNNDRETGRDKVVDASSSEFLDEVDPEA